MSSPPLARDLVDRAIALARDADTLARRAQHPFTRGQIQDVGMIARREFHGLVKSGGDPEVVATAVATLDVERTRLATLEELLDTHGVDAVPPGHA